MINDVTEKYSEIKQVLETYHNNFNQVVNEFEIIRRTTISLLNEIIQRNALIQSMNRIKVKLQYIFLPVHQILQVKIGLKCITYMIPKESSLTREK